MIKLSESLEILAKNREAEYELSKQVFMCQMIATFATSFIITIIAMFMAGVRSEDFGS